MKLILASKSPRRKKILEDNGFEIEIDVSNADEKSVKKDNVNELVVEIAKLKAETVAKRHKNSIIIAADTLVYFKGEEIGQQQTDEEAERTIRKLMGETHDVYTGIYIIDTANNKMVQDLEHSRITLKKISDDILDKYIKSGLYKGKAGAYNIDDPEFENFVENVEGSKSNITGLPIEKVKELLKKLNY